MYIKKLHISSFGTLTDRDIELSTGLNVIEGPNESGKTSAAMFIKFILYGLSGAKGIINEKQKYINWNTGVAAGYAVFVTKDGRELRAERKLTHVGTSDGKNQYRESARIVDCATGTPVHTSLSVGEFLLGVPEQVYVNTAFVRQQFGVKPDSVPLSQSMENILSSADEGVDVKKALQKLDDARIALLHKSRNGGLIRTLEDERDALMRSLEEDKDSAEETIKTEAALEEIKRKKDTAERNKDELDALDEALKIIRSKRDCDSREEIKKKIDETEQRLVAEREHGPDQRTFGVIESCERDFDALERAEKEAANVPDPGDGDGLPEEEDDFEETPYLEMDKAEKLNARSKVTLGFAVAILMIGLTGAGAAVWMFFSKQFDYLITGLASMAVIAVSFIVFAVRGNQRINMRSIIEKWGASSLDDLEESIGKTMEKRNEYYAALEKFRKAGDDLKAAQTVAVGARAELEQVGADLGLDESLFPETADKDLLGVVKTVSEKSRAAIASLEEERTLLTGKLSVMEEMKDDVDPVEVERRFAEIMTTPVGERAENMSAAEIKEAQRKRQFCHMSLGEMEKKEHELERTLAVLKATSVSPSETAEKIEELNLRIENLTRCHDAYVTAYETLQKAGDNVRSGILPKITKNASEMMRSISRGKYGSLSVSPKFDMFYDAGDAGTKEVDFMSSGTGDAAYLSLRLALIKALFDSETGDTPPVVFDESFSRLDEERLDAALSMLSSDSFGLQTLLCTCRRQESAAAERYRANRIEL